MIWYLHWTTLPKFRKARSSKHSNHHFFQGKLAVNYAARARPVPRRPSPRSKGTLLLLLPRHAVVREKGKRTAPVRRVASVRKPRQRFVNRVWRSCWFMLDIFRSGEWTQNFCWRWNCKFAHVVSLCMQRSEICFVLLGTQRASVRSSRRASAISHLDCNSVVRDGMPTTMKPLKIGFPKKGIFIYISTTKIFRGNTCSFSGGSFVDFAKIFVTRTIIGSFTSDFSEVALHCFCNVLEGIYGCQAQNPRFTRLDLEMLRFSDENSNDKNPWNIQTCRLRILSLSMALTGGEIELQWCLITMVALPPLEKCMLNMGLGDQD